jgi:hypothetical protein
VSRNFDWQDICVDNGQTNERLVVKTSDPHFDGNLSLSQLNRAKFVLVSRYPIGANQAWIEANEQEIMGWNFDEENRRIRIE